MKLMDRVTKSITGIGQSKTTAPPPASGRDDLVLHEFYIASRIRTLADSRYKKAKEAAVRLLKSSDVDAVRPGAVQSLVSGKFYEMLLKVNTAPQPKVDGEKLLEELALRQVPSQILEDARKASLVQANPAKNFIVTRRGED